MKPNFFTVFTPVYNRKHTIHRVWESLQAQTNRNFEWLIVDDGSEDGVEELLEKYKNDAGFTVRIFHQKNSGKHMAFNKAIDEAKGNLLIPADSDDSFVPTTIEEFDKNWKKYGNENISGIDVLCMDEEATIIGDKFPVEGVSNFINIFFKNKVKGEKWGCIRVDVLQRFKFPEMLGANFFPESYIWSQIGLNYKTVYLNIPLRIYYQDAGNQLMKMKSKSEGTLRIANYYGIWWVNNVFPKVSKYMGIKDLLHRFLTIWKSTFLLKESSFTTLKKIKSPKNKIIAAIIFIPAFVFVKILKK